MKPEDLVTWRRAIAAASREIILFEDSALAKKDHGSRLRIYAPSRESYSSTSSARCLQHPDAGIE